MNEAVSTVMVPAGADAGCSLPSSAELHGLFDSFLLRWTRHGSQYLDTPMEDVAYLPLEQSIYFSEPEEGLLVLRATGEFEDFLARSAAGRGDRAFFREMAALFWHELVRKVWGRDSRTLAPALCRASIPLQWPDRKPDSACTLFVENFPLEIRLWMGAEPGELDSWKPAARF